MVCVHFAIVRLAPPEPICGGWGPTHNLSCFGHITLKSSSFAYVLKSYNCALWEQLEHCQKSCTGPTYLKMVLNIEPKLACATIPFLSARGTSALDWGCQFYSCSCGLVLRYSCSQNCAFGGCACHHSEGNSRRATYSVGLGSNSGDITS